MNESLKRSRIHAGLTQEALARTLGVSSVSIYRWERQGKKPGPFHRQVLSEFFQLPESAFWPQEASPKEVPSPPGGPVLDRSLLTFSPRAALIGQHTLLKQLLQQLEQDDSEQIISLIGWPGQGKTKLLHALAVHPAVQYQFDGVLWATVGQNTQPLQHLRRWGQQLGLATLPESLEQAQEWMRLAIGERRILFLLDDLWENEVFAYLVGGPHCRAVFTTRQTRLALSHSQSVYRVPDLSDEEALTLLTRSLPLALVHVYRQQLEHLLRQVGKLPLALALLGEHLRCEARASSPRRFEEALRKLTQEAYSLRIPCSLHLHTHSPCSLAAVIRTSIQHLAPFARQALALLARTLPMGTPSFTEQQVMNVHQPDLPLHLLDHLVDAGLLEWKQEGWYWLHPVVAAYARVFLAGDEKQELQAG
jgi:transcriptional regulator with XRE-family HTH domain